MCRSAFKFSILALINKKKSIDVFKEMLDMLHERQLVSSFFEEIYSLALQGLLFHMLGSEL